MTNFDHWFTQLTSSSSSPYDWQRALADDEEPRSRLIRIPTGMGKTLGVLAAWSWHRLHRKDDRWPRRLVWCLPMRVLVEQTDDIIRDAIARLGLLWTDGDGRSHAGKVGVHQLMGGADAGGDWNLFPEECAVLVGTQDMLLSRALNRGYASGRARWPLEFGLLSHDTLWVMDEVQLMDVGLATSAQLQAFHDDDRRKGFRPRSTWWTSATLQPKWLDSVDTTAHFSNWTREPCKIPPERQRDGLGSIPKSIVRASIEAADAKDLARRVIEEHDKLVDVGYGRITLVICNTVSRASETFDALKDLGRTSGIELVHGRFRPYERVGWRERFLSRSNCAPGVDRVIVATQVVEAGVDISAGCVVTELAPWPNLVQRFGRCARYGGSGHVVIVDRGRDERSVLPYGVKEVEAAWTAAGSLNDVGTALLEQFEEALDEVGRESLYPYSAQHLLLRRELDELFDTTPDLTGGDLDIGRFIRTGDDRDLQVFWLDVQADEKRRPPKRPARSRSARREELCPVPFLQARDWLCGKETKDQRKPRLRKGVRAWVWDYLDGDWVKADRNLLSPGRIVCVAADVGGYRAARGFDSGAEDLVPVVPFVPIPSATEAQLQADRRQDGEDLSAAEWKTIACHTSEVVDFTKNISESIGLRDPIGKTLVLAARWHDVGKAHPAFQGAIRNERSRRFDLAKAPANAWPKPPKTYCTADGKDRRPGLRHELASALILFAVLERHAPRHPALLGPWVEVFGQLGYAVPEHPSATSPTMHERAVLDCTDDEFDLLVYLVACHHGKVRVSLHAAPKDQDYRAEAGDRRGLPIRGVRDKDGIPEIAIDETDRPLAAFVVSLEPATLGLSPRTGRSWRERTLSLLERFGPGALAWLEALIMAADRRASQLETPDRQLADWLTEGVSQ